MRSGTRKNLSVTLGKSVVASTRRTIHTAELIDQFDISFTNEITECREELPRRDRHEKGVSVAFPFLHGEKPFRVPVNTEIHPPEWERKSCELECPTFHNCA